jgi:hypothetical protein
LRKEKSFSKMENGLKGFGKIMEIFKKGTLSLRINLNYMLEVKI